MNRQYGWLKDKLDPRDFTYTAIREMIPTLPPSVDLRPQCPPVKDQDKLGACSAFASVGALEFDMLKQNETFTPLSELFVYYNTRAREGTIKSDSGGQIRDAIKVVNSLGACMEEDWPYNEDQFAIQPRPDCYQSAILHESVQYRRIAQDANQIKSVLAQGYPLVFGFLVYKEMESEEVAQTGIVPMPTTTETPLGGHAVLLCGYNDNKQKFIVRNSWGDSWGIAGYFLLDYDYVLNSTLADDFWLIQKIK